MLAKVKSLETLHVVEKDCECPLVFVRKRQESIGCN